MSVVKQLYLETSALVNFVDHFPTKEEEREQFFVELDERLAKRDHLIKQIDAQSLTENEKKLGHELLKLNNHLTERMGKIRTSIRRNITELEMKKETGLKYENPYDGPSSDGIFFDTQS